MSIHLDDHIQTGWEVFARDGSRVGTVAGIEGDQLLIALDDGQAQRTVPLNLVMEAHGGRVELDMPPDELGVVRPSGAAPAPTGDPLKPVKPVTPEQMRTGG